MASSESEQGTGFVERGTACYSTGIARDASWPAGPGSRLGGSVGQSPRRPFGGSLQTGHINKSATNRQVGS